MHLSSGRERVMSFASDLTVVIPGYNEMFMRRTTEDVLAKIRADTEVVLICDGSLPDPPVDSHPKVKVVHTCVPVGQRAATNLGASISRAKYIMKLDAHCAVDEGFDAKMIEDMQPDWTMIPTMYRLHAFDWTCNNCGHGEYQGSKPQSCANCGKDDLYRKMIWEPRQGVGPSEAWRFDRTMHMQYWYSYSKRPEVIEQKKTGVIETMSCVGCCFLMERERFWHLGGMDEGHGSWGQYGTELACKAWLSGGKMVTSTRTWFAHLFRTGNFSKYGESTFPYPISGDDQEAARKYSRDLWLNDKWPLAVRPLSWLVDHFAPTPDWHPKVRRRKSDRRKDRVA